MSGPRMSGVWIHLEGRRALGNRGLHRGQSQCAGGLEEPAAPGVPHTLRQVQVGEEKVCEAGTVRARCPGQQACGLWLNWEFVSHVKSQPLAPPSLLVLHGSMEVLAVWVLRFFVIVVFV